MAVTITDTFTSELEFNARLDAIESERQRFLTYVASFDLPPTAEGVVVPENPNVPPYSIVIAE